MAFFFALTIPLLWLFHGEAGTAEGAEKTVDELLEQLTGVTEADAIAKLHEICGGAAVVHGSAGKRENARPRLSTTLSRRRSSRINRLSPVLPF